MSKPVPPTRTPLQTRPPVLDDSLASQPESAAAKLARLAAADEFTSDAPLQTKTAQAHQQADAAPAAESTHYPWEGMDTRLVSNFLLRLPAGLQLKLDWLKEQNAMRSKHGFIMAALERAVDEELAKLEVPESKR